MKKRLTFLLGALALALSACGPIPHTGFEIVVFRPDTTRFRPGVDYNTLYVHVLSDGVEQAQAVPIGAATPAPYKFVVTMDGVKHQKAVITVSLKSDDTVRVSYIQERAVVQGELSVYNVDFTNQ